MISNQQVRKLRQLDRQGIAKEVAALRVGMDAKSAQVSPARQVAQRGPDHG